MYNNGKNVIIIIIIILWCHLWITQFWWKMKERILIRFIIQILLIKSSDFIFNFYKYWHDCNFNNTRKLYMNRVHDGSSLLVYFSIFHPQFDFYFCIVLVSKRSIVEKTNFIIVLYCLWQFSFKLIFHL